MKPPREVSAEEIALWREANQLTTPRHRHPPDSSIAPEVESPPLLGAERSAMGSPPPSPRRAADHSLTPISDRRRARRVLKPYGQIAATLDLHGLTRYEAMDRVAQFITKAYRSGQRHVVIITGKGRGAAMGVLRAQLPDWLNEATLRPMIAATAYAALEKGGNGVMHVLLKRL